MSVCRITGTRIGQGISKFIPPKKLQTHDDIARSQEGSVEGVTVEKNGFMKPFLRCTKPSSEEPKYEPETFIHRP